MPLNSRSTALGTGLSIAAVGAVEYSLAAHSVAYPTHIGSTAEAAETIGSVTSPEAGMTGP